MHFAKESIIKSGFRTCLKAFSMIIGLFLGVVLIMLALMGLTSSSNYLPQMSDVSLMPDAYGNREMVSARDPAILRLDITGVVGLGDLTGSAFQNVLLDSRENLLSHDRVKAILLYIDTPGGAVTDADTIYRSLLAYKEKYKTPIYAYVDGMCASGGMYIASAADKIYASPTSVIGSVGVILGPTFNFSQVMEKIGIQSLTLTEGKDKDALNPFRPWRPGEDASLQTVIAYMYERFVNIVTTARPRLDKQKLINEYGAHIFDASEAEAFGYIDVANAEYNRALQDLVAAAGVAENQSYQVVKLSTPHSLFSEFASGKLSLLKGKVSHTFPLAPEFDPSLSGKFLYLYSPSTHVQ